LRKGEGSKIFWGLFPFPRGRKGSKELFIHIELWWGSVIVAIHVSAIHVSALHLGFVDRERKVDADNLVVCGWMIVGVG